MFLFDNQIDLVTEAVIRSPHALVICRQTILLLFLELYSGFCCEYKMLVDSKLFLLQKVKAAIRGQASLAGDV
uniref:Uncharacterized protein n=1 Tax=Rhizobium leguminosarum TaxID=384 RepID=A0A179BPB5_RHILE|nr:hypothetical protein A4U53_24810 [Rhizobium leguminosarum]